MYCNKCGMENADSSNFCQRCGAALSGKPEITPDMGNSTASCAVNQSVPGTGMAVAGMVCGIVSIFFYGFITGILGIVFGAVAKRKGYTGGMATAGIACGAVGLALWLIIILIAGIGIGQLAALA